MKHVFILIFLFTVSVFAEETKYVSGLGFSSRQQDEANPKNQQNLQVLTGFFQMKTKSPKYEITVDLNRVQNETKDGMLVVGYTRYELMSWLRYMYNPEAKWRWFAGSGAGLSQDRVEASLGNGSAINGRSDIVSMIGLQGGVNRTFYQFYYTELGLRYFVPLASRERDPEFDVAFRVGYRF